MTTIRMGLASQELVSRQGKTNLETLPRQPIVGMRKHLALWHLVWPRRFVRESHETHAYHYVVLLQNATMILLKMPGN